MRLFSVGTLFVLLVGVAAPAWAQKLEVRALSETDAVAGKANAEEPAAERNKRLEEMLSQVKLIGQFTVVGRENNRLSKEEYTIQKVEKLPDGDKWLFHSRIKYGDHDLTIPLPIDVQWAGKTPVITLDEMTIPGLGTFSSRVVLHDNKYAGTWRHDKVSGHLFGVIEKVEKPEKSDDSTK